MALLLLFPSSTSGDVIQLLDTQLININIIYLFFYYYYTVPARRRRSITPIWWGGENVITSKYESIALRQSRVRTYVDRRER